MRSLSPEIGGMDIDSGDDEDSTHRHDLKRTWQQFLQDTDDDASPPSTPPEFKRQRTEVPPPPQQPLPTETRKFSLAHHALLIELIQQHGGAVVSSNGDLVELTLPPRSDLHFQVRYFCLYLARPDQVPPLPGALAFGESTFAQFASHLHTATLANEPQIVRQLLATGLANNAGHLLRNLAQQARAAGATAAVDAITDSCAYWIDGLDPTTLDDPAESSIRIGDSDQPPANWQAGVRQDLTEEQGATLLTAFRNGDTRTVCELLFMPGQQPASGKFVLHPVIPDVGAFATLLQSHGAVSVSGGRDIYFDEEKYCIVFRYKSSVFHRLNEFFVYSSDFDSDGMCRELLRQQAADPEAAGGKSTSPLKFAAKWRDAALLQTLWSQTTEAQRNCYAKSALKYAVFAGATNIVRQLLAQINDPQSLPEEYLQEAARGGYTAICAMLLQVGIGLQFTSSALQDAASCGHTETCAFLISHGAPLDDGLDNTSPLLQAARHGHQKICQLLIAAGAHVGRLNDEQDSVLSLAAYSGNVILYQSLLDLRVDQFVPPHHSPPMVCAAKYNHVAMLDYLLKLGEDKERADDKGHTPLTAACKTGATEAVELLLQHNANPIPRGSLTDNAITWAIRCGKLSTFQKLLPIELPTIYWTKALQEAIRRALPKMVSALLPRCSVNPLVIQLPTAESPLLLIPYHKVQPARGEALAHHRVLSILLEDARLPLHHVTANGDDALILAVRAKDTLAVEMLINAGLRVGQVNHEGKHALHYAIDTSTTDVNRSKNNRDEDSDEDSDATEPKHMSSRILRAVSQTLLQHPHQLHLAKDVLLSETDPIKRDLALFLMVANSISNADIPQLMTLHVSDRDLRNSALRHSVDVSNAELAPVLTQMGVPSALHERLISLISALPQIGESLFKKNVNTHRSFQAALDGLHLILEGEAATLNATIAAYYATTALDDEWKATLTTMCQQWLSHRIVKAAERQPNEIGAVFGELFDRCVASTMNGDDYLTALKQSAPEPGKVAAALYEAGVYAALADEIDVAWSQAWQKVKLSPAALLDLRSNDHLADELLTAFRQALNDRVDTPSAEGHLINRINEPAEAATLYADLMFQQLHMLKQFITPEPN